MNVSVDMKLAAGELQESVVWRYDPNVGNPQLPGSQYRMDTTSTFLGAQDEYVGLTLKATARQEVHTGTGLTVSTLIHPSLVPDVGSLLAGKISNFSVNDKYWKADGKKPLPYTMSSESAGPDVVNCIQCYEYRATMVFGSYKSLAQEDREKFIKILTSAAEPLYEEYKKVAEGVKQVSVLFEEGIPNHMEGLFSNAKTEVWMIICADKTQFIGVYNAPVSPQRVTYMGEKEYGLRNYVTNQNLTKFSSTSMGVKDIMLTNGSFVGAQ